MRLPRSIATSVDKVAKQTIGKDWNLYAVLLNHWREIVGEEYAQVTTPVKIVFPQGKATSEKWAQGHRSDGVLHIRLPQGMAMEFTYLTDQIRQRIGSYFGYEVIARIVLDPFYGAPAPAKEVKPPLPAPTPEQTAWLTDGTKDIEDNELRDALKELGHAVCQDEKTPR